MATVTVFFDTRRAKDKCKYPVKLTIYHNREKQRYGLGIDLKESEWQKINSPNLRDEELKKIKAKLDVYTTKASNVIEKLGDSFTFNSFELEFFEKGTRKKESNNVYEAFEEYIEKLNKEDRIGNVVAYTSALNSLKSFRKKLSFHDVTPDFLDSYEKEMLKDEKSITTVGIYLRSLRHIMNIAIDKGILKPQLYPFKKGKYEIPASRNEKQALKFDELKTILNYKTDLIGERKAIDFWIFSYLCNGMNMADICRLKYKNIDGDYLLFVRKKTSRTKRTDIKAIRCFMIPEVKTIIKKYGNQDITPDTYIFPILEPDITAKREHEKIQFFTRNVNKYMKQIATKIGINSNISTYAARHSYATVLKRKGASIDYIKDSLGHSDLKTTENYLDSFLDETIKVNTSLLTDL
jgi:integrase